MGVDKRKVLNLKDGVHKSRYHISMLWEVFIWGMEKEKMKATPYILGYVIGFAIALW